MLQEKRSRVSESQDLAAASSVKAKTLGSYFKISSISPEEPPSFHQVVEAELSSYLTASTIDGEENPLTWWKEHQVNFPRLSRLACRYLCVPATSTPSERLFSAAGNIVTCQRSCLKPERVDMLLFLSKNL